MTLSSERAGIEDRWMDNGTFWFLLDNILVYLLTCDT